MTSSAVYEVYAVRFAHNEAATRGEHFYGGERRPSEPHPTDYFLWVARSAEETVVVDAGFTEETARRRRRTYLESPITTLGRLGVDAGNVRHLVISHLHWDHTGHMPSFPSAQITIQEREMAFWTGRWAGRGEYGRTLEPDDVMHLVRRNWDGGVRFADGEQEVAPGITVHLVGGHTPGMQVTRVPTRSGPIVLASDASHYYENFERDRPFSVLTHLPGMYGAFDRINALAGSAERVVPGHDPLVMERFPPATRETNGLAVRID